MLVLLCNRKNLIAHSFDATFKELEANDDLLALHQIL